MKVVQILESCTLQGGTLIQEINLEKNTFYIISDDFYKKLKLIAESIVGVEIPFKDVFNHYSGEDLTNKRLLAIRHGGGGDILFMTTALSEIKRRYPSSKLGVAISRGYFDLVNHHPDINKIFSLPISLNDWSEFHYHITFENIIENNLLAEQFNAYDLFLNQVGLNIKEVDPENKIPKIYISKEEEDLMKESFPTLKSQNKRVGIQVESSSPIRNYPIHNFVPICAKLIQKGYDVFLFGTHPQENAINFIFNSLKTTGKIFKVLGTLREAIIIAKQMSFFIAPDSMFIHIAGAFRVPVIGLYGPFHSSLRMLYFKNSAGINSQTPCSPCFTHGHHPCVKGEPSPCLSNITPEVVLETFEKVEASINTK